MVVNRFLFVFRGGWKYEFCDVCGNFQDCLIGCCVPQVEAGLAANNAGQDLVWAALQCLFFPILVPLLRNQVREQQGIEVRNKSSQTIFKTV